MRARAKFKFAFSSEGAKKKKTKDGFVRNKTPEFRDFLAATCVPGRNSNLHLFPRFATLFLRFRPNLAECISGWALRENFLTGRIGTGRAFMVREARTVLYKRGGVVFGLFSILRVKGLFR